MIRVIVTDIEGTTSSIKFVHEVLFPYAAEHIGEFVLNRAGADQAVDEQLDAVAAEANCDRSDIQGLVAVLLSWIDEDRKATPLKALQGMVWADGYRTGAFRGHVYADAAEYLRIWHDRGLRLYVYSSGSVAAQKLLFGYSEAGDLTPLFSGYFDTRIGGKRESGSYSAIVEQLGVDAGEVIFLSDIAEELLAAESVGMHSAWLVRDSKKPDSHRPVAANFSEVDAILQGQ